MLEFDWDEANIQHIAEHNVKPSEAEEVVEDDPLDLEMQVINGEERFVQVGTTKESRILRVVTTLRGPLIRVVTAYDAPRRDRIVYEIWRLETYGTAT